MRNLMLVVAILALITAGFAIESSDKRAVVAPSWSSDELNVSAIGTFNRTLLTTPADGDTDKCPMFVAEVVADQKLSNEITAEGFASIRCGNYTSSLK